MEDYGKLQPTSNRAASSRSIWNSRTRHSSIRLASIITVKYSLKIEAVCFSETLVPIYETACHNPGSYNMTLYRHDSLFYMWCWYLLCNMLICGPFDSLEALFCTASPGTRIYNVIWMHRVVRRKSQYGQCDSRSSITGSTGFVYRVGWHSAEPTSIVMLDRTC
jgi:hypothetical protein